MIRLGPNQYGKAETRLVRVGRDGDRHDLTDLNVSVALAGELDESHLRGDNSNVLPTDSQKNTVYAFARKHGIGEIEAFGLRLARHFVDSQPAIHRAIVTRLLPFALQVRASADITVPFVGRALRLPCKHADDVPALQLQPAHCRAIAGCRALKTYF